MVTFDLLLEGAACYTSTALSRWNPDLASTGDGTVVLDE